MKNAAVDSGELKTWSTLPDIVKSNNPRIFAGFFVFELCPTRSKLNPFEFCAVEEGADVKLFRDQ
jgi:hypothetical protein